MGLRSIPSNRMVAVGAAAVAALCMAAPVHADATLDKVRQRGKLVVGVDGASPPFGVLDPATGKVGGFQAELGADIARRLGVTLETVPVTASTRVQFLQAGKVDLLIANIQWTQERSEILSYAPTPYNLVGGAAMVSKKSGIKRWEDLRGKVAQFLDNLEELDADRTAHLEPRGLGPLIQMAAE